ncbi:MAG TPA: cytochrome b/b6 domain-containing protein, partial [Candidatus Methanoperedens sp.]|nr:cytochrome b/b6 domain-containing protein [Candidatus Methanoperedens sp.]
RLNLQQRLQHGLYALAVSGTLATGLLLGRPSGVGARGWHLLLGFAALALLVYHLLYLTVRGYVEARGWSTFPLRWARGDWAAVAAEFRYLAGRTAERPEAGEFRVSQRAFYWWCLAATLALAVTGIGVGYWERLGSLGLLTPLAQAHRGCALVFLATCLWHLHGVLVWEGLWWPEWSWLGGSLDAEKAQRKVPGAWRRHLEKQGELAAAAQISAPDERVRARQVQEKEEVQAELERGNTLALEERYVEALHHYRRALELYPGYSQALYNMARVLARMGERQMARETYRQFLDADPFHPLARKAQEAVRELAEGGDGP